MAVSVVSPLPKRLTVVNWDKNGNIYIYIIQILCVCVSVKYRRPNGWTDHDQIWHVYADRPGNGSYQKKWSNVWSGRVGSLGPFFEAGT